jgi:hypothetical protein
MNMWKGQIGRITLFPAAPTGPQLPSAIELYRQVWGGDPDSFQKQANPLAPSVAQGIRNGFVVACTAQPLRFDYTVGPIQPNDSQASLALIDDFRGFRAELNHVTHTISQSSQSFSVSRAACSAQFAREAANHREANGFLMAVMPEPYRLKLTDEEEVIVQVNRPVRGDPSMNFITKWSVERLQFYSIALDATSGQPSSTNRLIKEHLTAAVSFDNSNNIMPRFLTKKEQANVLNASLQGISSGIRENNLAIEGF